MATVSLALELLRLADPRRAECPRCLGPLDLHQPREDQPERLLGTCEGCRGWFLIDAEAAVMIRLPDEADWRRGFT